MADEEKVGTSVEDTSTEEVSGEEVSEEKAETSEETA